MTGTQSSRPPILFILSGPSGVGKDSLIQELRQTHPELHVAVTATTRQPRPGEVEGESYFFLTPPAYDALLDEGELLAPAEVHGNRYGAPLEPIRRAFESERDVLLKIDVQGAIQVRRRFPQAVFIFLTPSTLEDLVERLRARHTESEEELDRRLRDARFEMSQLPQYDYCVTNRDDDLAHAVSAVACIITAEQHRILRQPLDLSKR